MSADEPLGFKARRVTRGACGAIVESHMARVGAVLGALVFVALAACDAPSTRSCSGEACAGSVAGAASGNAGSFGGAVAGSAAGGGAGAAVAGDAGKTAGGDAGHDAGGEGGIDAGVTCVGDGVTDDTACLQAAIDQAPGRLTVSAGATYLITGHLYVPGPFVLDGNHSTLLLTTPDIMLLLAGSDVTVRSWHLDYQAASSYAGLIDLAPATTNVTIQDCTFTGAQALAGVHIDNPDIEGVRILDSTFDGIVYGVLTNTTQLSPTELTDVDKHLFDLTVEGNTMTELSGDGVEINSPVMLYAPYNSGVPGVAAHGITIKSNTIRAPHSDRIERGFCIGIAGASDVTIEGNILEDCKWQGIHLEDKASDLLIVDNQIRRVVGNEADDASGWTTARSGILLLDVDHVDIFRNTIESVVDVGVELSYDGTHFVHDVRVAETSVTTAGTYGFFAGGVAGQALNSHFGPVLTFDGNTATACASGAILVAPGTEGVTVIGNVNF